MTAWEISAETATPCPICASADHARRSRPGLAAGNGVANELGEGHEAEKMGPEKVAFCTGGSPMTSFC